MSKQGDMANQAEGEAQGARPQRESATGEVNATSTGEQCALAAVRGDLGPLSADELTAFRTNVAREYARAEARRAPSPQLNLPEAA
jgi:hypothetical protein